MPIEYSFEVGHGLMTQITMSTTARKERVYVTVTAVTEKSSKCGGTTFSGVATTSVVRLGGDPEDSTYPSNLR